MGFTENVPSRFKSYGWNVIKDVNGHDFVSIRNAINKAKLEKNRPTIISAGPCRLRFSQVSRNKPSPWCTTWK